eukprot:01212.XXX_4016_2589_1 [CDS] Oithona nana genome sequencing.
MRCLLQVIKTVSWQSQRRNLHVTKVLGDKSLGVGIVGMGHVGNAVCHNLLRKGYKVTAINDIKTENCQGYPETIQIKETAREVAEISDVVVSGLPKPPDVLKAASGSDGILAGLKNGSVWIDHSTTAYEQNLMFEEEASKKGAHILESPITGGLEALKKGQMAVWVAGDVEAYKKTKGILDASYTTVMYTGELGTAMIPKVLSNMLCAVQVLAMSECFAIAQRSGMDLNLFWHSIRASAGNSFLWETAGPNIFRGEYHDSFNMDLMCKDIQLCFEMAKSSKVPIEFLGHMQQLYTHCLYQFGPDVGCYGPPKILEDALKTEYRAKGFENWTYEVENIDGALHVRHKNIDLKVPDPAAAPQEANEK